MKRKIVIIGLIVLISAVIGMGVGVVSSGGRTVERKLETAYDFLQDHNYEEAIILFLEVLAIEGQEHNIQAIEGLIQAYVADGQSDVAIEYLYRLIAEDENFTWAYERLARLLGELGDRSGAVLVLNKGFSATGEEALIPLMSIYEEDLPGSATYEDTVTDNMYDDIDVSDTFVDESDYDRSAEEDVTQYMDENQEDSYVSGYLWVYEELGLDPYEEVVFEDPVLEEFIRDNYGLYNPSIRRLDLAVVEYLELYDMELMTLNDLKWLSNLQNLNLYQIKVSEPLGLETFIHCPYIRGLYIQTDFLDMDLGALELSVMLNEVMISSKTVTGDLVSLRNLPQLYYLELTGDQFIGDIESLSQYPSLDQLVLMECQITGDIGGLASTPYLSSLQLINVPVSGDLAELEGHFFYNLFLQDTEVTGEYVSSDGWSVTNYNTQ